jgi:hypothetical protein
MRLRWAQTSPMLFTWQRSDGHRGGGGRSQDLVFPRVDSSDGGGGRGGRSRGGGGPGAGGVSRQAPRGYNSVPVALSRGEGRVGGRHACTRQAGQVARCGWRHDSMREQPRGSPPTTRQHAGRRRTSSPAGPRPPTGSMRVAGARVAPRVPAHHPAAWQPAMLALGVPGHGPHMPAPTCMRAALCGARPSCGRCCAKRPPTSACRGCRRGGCSARLHILLCLGGLQQQVCARARVWGGGGGRSEGSGCSHSLDVTRGRPSSRPGSC